MWCVVLQRGERSELVEEVVRWKQRRFLSRKSHGRNVPLCLREEDLSGQTWGGRSTSHVILDHVSNCCRVSPQVSMFDSLELHNRTGMTAQTSASHWVPWSSNHHRVVSTTYPDQLSILPARLNILGFQTRKPDNLADKQSKLWTLLNR